MNIIKVNGSRLTNCFDLFRHISIHVFFSNAIPFTINCINFLIFWISSNHFHKNKDLKLSPYITFYSKQFADFFSPYTKNPFQNFYFINLNFVSKSFYRILLNLKMPLSLSIFAYWFFYFYYLLINWYK